MHPTPSSSRNLVRDERRMRIRMVPRAHAKSLQIETRATGLEPATSGVTGHFAVHDG
jgi:hypothetical protein